MSSFERDLRKALSRRDPPEGFAENVLARARASERPLIPRLWLAAAAMVLILVGGVFYQQYRQAAASQRAKEQLIAGLRITGAKVQILQRHLARLERHSIELPAQQ
jgi:hypothetical protein